MISDPNTLLLRVMEYAVGKSPRLAAALISPERSPGEDFLVEVLGGHLAGLFESAPQQQIDVEEKGGEEMIGTDLPADYQALAERNSQLAAALGACYCWGEDPSCPDCNGQGNPGRQLPQRDMFSHYVRPAIETIKQIRQFPRWQNGPPRPLSGFSKY